MAKIIIDGDKIISHRVIDPNPALDAAKMMRDNPKSFGDGYHVGRVPIELISIWLKEAGVLWSDTEAAEEVVWRKLMDPEFKDFRIWQGKA